MIQINRSDGTNANGQGGYGGGQSKRPKPGPGAYVCRIVGCEEGVTRNGSPVMHINIDIYEGEFANYYRDLYDRSRFEPKRWGCVYNIYEPSPSQPWQQDKIDRFLENIEKSNPGYKWDNIWEGLVGKLIGMSFRNEQYRSFTADDGREVPSGWKVKPKDACFVDDVRAGNVKTPEDRPLPENQGQSQQYDFNQIPQNGGQAQYGQPAQAQQPYQQAPSAQPQAAPQSPQYTPPVQPQTPPQEGTPQNMQSPPGSVGTFTPLDDDSELPF